MKEPTDDTAWTWGVGCREDPPVQTVTKPPLTKVPSLPYPTRSGLPSRLRSPLPRKTKNELDYERRKDDHQPTREEGKVEAWKIIFTAGGVIFCASGIELFLALYASLPLPERSLILYYAESVEAKASFTVIFLVWVVVGIQRKFPRLFPAMLSHVPRGKKEAA